LNSNLYEDLGLDSLDRYELLYLTEGEFDIILEDEKANEFETIRDVCDYIKSHQ
jgi:acyl carrier protein